MNKCEFTGSLPECHFLNGKNDNFLFSCLE